MELNKTEFQWAPDALLEVTLPNPDAFLKIRETLTRIGIASNRDQTLFQTCHILHKKGKYYITNFLELFALDGRPTSITYEDMARRNMIASLLEQWGLCSVVSTPFYVEVRMQSTAITVIPHAQKANWKLVPKYTIGKPRAA